MTIVVENSSPQRIFIPAPTRRRVTKLNKSTQDLVGSLQSAAGENFGEFGSITLHFSLQKQRFRTGFHS